MPQSEQLTPSWIVIRDIIEEIDPAGFVGGENEYNSMIKGLIEDYGHVTELSVLSKAVVKLLGEIVVIQRPLIIGFCREIAEHILKAFPQGIKAGPLTQSR